MTEENKRRIKNQILKDNERAERGYKWHIIDGLLGEEVSSLAWGEDCEIIYVDMDGYPSIGLANYHKDIDRFVGVSASIAGNRMSMVVAYKRIKEKQNENNV